MKKRMEMSVLFCVAALGAPKADRKPEVDGAHIPPHGPAQAKAAGANDISEDRAGHPQVLHSDAKNDKRVGHVTGPGDPHYKLAQPWALGHFNDFGPQHVFTLARGGPERFWFGKFYWPVAFDDFNFVANWHRASGLGHNVQGEYLG